MRVKALRPATRQRESGLGGIACLAASTTENSIPSIIVNRISQRFGVTVPHAATIAQLAHLGPREAR